MGKWDIISDEPVVNFEPIISTASPISVDPWAIVSSESITLTEAKELRIEDIPADFEVKTTAYDTKGRKLKKKMPENAREAYQRLNDKVSVYQQILDCVKA